VLTESELKQLKTRLKNEFSDYKELAGGKNFRYFHLRSVHQYSRKLMSCEEVSKHDFDPRVVEVAALFHDIGRSLDIENGYMDPFEGRKGHAERGKEIISGFVSDYLNEKQVKKVEKIVGNHHSEPETVEGKIVQDADELFKFGVQDFWRMFHYAAEKERTIDESIDYFHETAVPELEKRLEDFYFETTVETAKERIREQKETIKKIERSLKGEDII